ncbi:MAG TPA: hypothetical protein VGD94_24165 [Vicinamibacterales bacterium]
MRSGIAIAGALASACLLLACDDSPTPAAPAEVSAPVQSASVPSGPSIALDGGGRRLLMIDQCDPESFNTAIGPGTCIDRNGGVTFQTFISLLEKHQTVNSWRFSPDTIHVPRELTLPIVNAGGEVHTFTEVAEFGGGIVPDLNNLTGTPVPAAECLALAPSDFIAPGGQTTHTFEPGEADKYQCCIHPWMRAQTR